MRKILFAFICLIFGWISVIAQSSPPKEWSKGKIKNTVSPPLRNTPYQEKELDYGLLLGAVNSLTDIGNGTQTINDYQYMATNISAGTYVRYRFSRYFGVSGSLLYGRLKGHDSLSPKNGPYERYKGFENNIIEMAVRGEFYFARKQYKMGKVFERKNNLYIFAGAAGFHHLPSVNVSWTGTPKEKEPVSPSGGKSAFSSEQNTVLDTTKNIIYHFGFDPTNYCFAIPVGFGYNHTFKSNFRIGFDVGYRYAFTDYLDGFTSSNNKNMDSYIFAHLVFGYVIKYSDTFKIKFNRRKFNKRYYW